MELLQINSTLRHIEFSNVDSWLKHREAQVVEALRTKARQEKYLTELRPTLGTSATGWAHPTCGRVFLCGNAMAGKTQLTDTMLRSEAPWYKRLLGKLIPRTRGIEIQVLKNDESMQLSLWDLAGQDIFRALQEYLFPKLNKACVFLFVFSLYDRETEALKPKLEVALEEELLYWLKFITSNSRMTGFSLPQVMVVLTHKDKTQDNINVIGCALPVVKKLQKEFSDVLNFSSPAFVEDPEQEDTVLFSLNGGHDQSHQTETVEPDLFFVDGRAMEDVKPILREVYGGFKKLFQKKLFRVPEACCQVSSFLLGWALKNPKRPIVTFEEFKSLCADAHPAVKDYMSSRSVEEKEKLLRAVASYLHDVGTIIEFPNQNIMVVNPNWLTHAFLGNFIGRGNDFDRAREREAAPPTSDNGFLLRSQFQRFVEENVLLPLTTEGYHLDFEMLQILMEGLDLCFKVPTGEWGSYFFVPTLFIAQQQGQLQWRRPCVKGEPSYLGLRIRCEDQRRTSLSAGFFPRFQISLWRKMIQSLAQGSKIVFECKYNLISILHDGHDVLVEKEEDGSFLDILVRSEKSRESVRKFVQKHILQELYDFCASAKGPPGVTLVDDVLRTECVRQLTKCVDRRNQAISREFLKENLKQSMTDQGKTGADESGDLFKHTWPVAGRSLPAECEAALDLLSPQEVLDVGELVRFEATALIERAKKSDEVLQEFCRTSNGSAAPELYCKGTTSVDETSEDHGQDPTSLILREIGRVGHRVEELHGKFDELKDDIMRMSAQFAKARRTAQHSFTRLFQHMDRLIGISHAYSQLPRRPFFTAKDASWSHRMKAKINVGEPLILHFACEKRDGNHVVLDQPGYELIVGERNREWLRVILRNSVKALWCILKAGLHVTTSLGTVVPDLQVEVSDSKYISLATLSMSSILDILEPSPWPDARSSNVVGSSASAQKAWQYLLEHLKGDLLDRIPHHFSLYPARYTDSKTENLSAYAWLCKDCRDAGIADGTIRTSSSLFHDQQPLRASPPV